MRIRRAVRTWHALAVIVSHLLLAACGGGNSGSPQVQNPPPTFKIGGSVAGLDGTIVLDNNGGDSVSISANGNFTFPTAIAAGAYSVTVAVQPDSQSCAVTKGSGTAGSNVATVQISCTTITYNVSGHAAGVLRPISLQNNGSDTLIVSGNGAFTFSLPVKKSTPYSVALLSPGLAQVCAVANGSGNVTGNITDVSITCTVDSSTSLLPFVVQPVPGTVGGKQGLVVSAANAIDESPTGITTDTVSVLGYTLAYDIDSTGAAKGRPASTMIYTTGHASSTGHLWALDLAPDSTLIPRQLGSKALDPSCAYSGKVLQTDLNDPSTGFVLLQVPDVEPCLVGATTGSHFVLIRLSDSATTDPRSLPALNFFIEFLPLYSLQGTLTGILAVDASHNLNFYSDETFSTTSTVLSGVASFASRSTAPAASAWSTLSATPGYDFILVDLLSGTPAASLYRVDRTGVISADLHDFSGEGGGQTTDGQNAYFVDVDTVTSTTSMHHILQVPLDGHAPAQIINSHAMQGANAFTGLLGSTATTLFIERIGDTGPGTDAATSTLNSIQLAAPSASNVLATFTNGATVTAQWLDNYLLVTMTQGDSSGPVFHLDYASEILNFDGSVASPLAAHSAIVASADSVYQVRDIASGGYGGGSFYHLSMGNVLGAPVLRTYGALFTIPSDPRFDVILGLLSPSISGLDAGLIIPPGGASVLTIDPVNNMMRTLTIPNSSVGLVTNNSLQ